MLDKVKEIMTRYVELDPSEIKEDSRLAEDLALTSFAVMSMMGDFEEEFGITVDESELTDIHTVGDIMATSEQEAAEGRSLWKLLKLHTLQDLLVLAGAGEAGQGLASRKGGKDIAEKRFGELLEDSRKVSSFLRRQGGRARSTPACLAHPASPTSPVFLAR